jgi:heterotetrameric sarcosine oxidase gamma subunit
MPIPKFRIERLPARSFLLLQIHGSSLQAMSGVQQEIFGGVSDRRSPVTGPRAFWIGPTEWLLLDHGIVEVQRRVLSSAGRALVQVTDVSDAFASFRIEGSLARSVLTADIGAPRDVATATPERYLRTRLGQVDVVLHCVDDSGFEVHVDRSLADYLERWLQAQHTHDEPPQRAH